MKAKSILTVILVLVFSVATAAHFWRGATLAEKDVEKRWGRAEFDADKFKNGDKKIRASMASVILKNKKLFIGKFVLDLRKELGDPDGFYFRDVFPAYMIQEIEDGNSESWQIVFLLNKERKVDDVIIHKNCCD
jgi:hypothetical protein